MTNQLDEIRTQVLTENTAQGVLNYLKEQESNRSQVRARWIWELLQNARDASTAIDTDLSVSIEQDEGKLVFRHSGASFKREEIAHLIYHGSTKVDSTETIGQYGSGFLTTHLLSPEIVVSGQLDSGEYFQFHLKREVGSVSQLSQSMERAWEAFKDSLVRTAPQTDDLPTGFLYPLDRRGLEAVDAGIATLKLCAPLVLAFNEEFSSIAIKSPNGTTDFKVVERARLEQYGLHKVTVTQIQNDDRTETEFLLAQGDKATVAVPLKSTDNASVCLPVGNIPRLFLGFPLMGTGNFSFPAIINSLYFTPTDNRHGAYLGQSDNDANLENQAVVEEACRLLINLLRHIGSHGWYDTYHLARIPVIQEQDWLNTKWLRQCIEERFVERVRQIPVVLNESDQEIPPDRLKLPVAETHESIVTLWNLLDGWDGMREVLPRKNEAVGWNDVLASWATMAECEVSSFEQAVDGRKLASDVHTKSHDPKADQITHRISRLNLKDGVSEVGWLDRLIRYLEDNGLRDVLREYRVIPSQESFLRTLNNLGVDQGIQEELKDIAHLLDWRVRCELRDTRLTSLRDEPGAGNWDVEYVLGQLISKLKARAAVNPDAKFQEASVRLFTWLVREDRPDLLGGFPMFVGDSDLAGSRIIHLSDNLQDNDRPLAPVRAWDEDLRKFSDLFPPTSILADAFFEASPRSEVWEVLNDRGFVRTNILTTNEEPFDRFFPDYPLPEGTHRTSGNVTTTDIARRAQIMDRVRDSRERGRLLWRFLTEWLIKVDSQSLEIQEANCECGETHRYYPADWITSLKENAWVRLANEGRDRATAQSLADLLRGSDSEPISLDRSDAAASLLGAIGITRLDLMREFVAEDDDARIAVDDAFTDMLTTTGGDVSYLNHAQQYIEDLKGDDGLPEVLEERRKRRRIVHDNQFLGKRVEDLVKESLEDEGFRVQRTGVGSDFKIEYDSAETGDIGRLELSKSGRTWLVEVKATRDQDVRMSVIQAKTAREQKDGFLLCVVPVQGETDELELEDIQATIRFVQNIGSRVGALCDDIDELDDVRDRITTGAPSDVRLEVVSGTARVRVSNSVWQNDGFPIAELPDRLR